MSKVTPFLMFNDQLEAAIEFYAGPAPSLERTSTGWALGSRGFQT